MINLFINYFDHDNQDRKKEIEYCLEMNKANELIDNIIIVNRFYWFNIRTKGVVFGK